MDRWQVPTQADRKNLLFFDRRLYEHGFGMNGYVTLEFADESLTVQHYDLRGSTPLLEEQWKISGGQIQRMNVKQNCLEPDFYGPAKWG